VRGERVPDVRIKLSGFEYPLAKEKAIPGFKQSRVTLRSLKN